MPDQPLRGRQPTRPALRLPAELSLFAVTAAVALGFNRLFTGWSFLPPVLAVAASSHLLAGALRRRGVPVALAAVISAGGLVLVTSWVFYAATTRYGLPNGSTLHAFRADLDSAVQRFREEKAPTEAVTGFVATSAAGFWLVAFLADWSAFRLWAPFEATIPAGALFVFASLLGANKSRAAAAGAFFLASVVFLLLHRVSRQEASPSWVRGDSQRGARALLSVGATIVGIAVVAAALVGPLLPGAQAGAVFDLKHIGSNNGTRVTVSPLVDIRQRLVDQRDSEVFTVSTPERAYWRLTALDEFDGRVWRSSKRFEKVQGTLPTGGSTAFSRQVDQEFVINNLSQIWLPAAFEPRAIRDAQRQVRFEPTTDTLIVDKATSNGLRYSVTSAVPRFSVERLRRANDTPPADITAQFLQLPNEFSDKARQLAINLTAGAATPYDRAMALETYFRTSYTYSTQVAGGHSVKRLEDFLFAEVKQGYCEQFAGSFAALARAVGLPARVAVGFTPGDPDPADPTLYHVKGRHAHAWPEVYLTGLGWVLFEPTPTRGAPNAAYTGAPEQQDSEIAPHGVLSPTTTSTTVAAGDDLPVPELPLGSDGTVGPRTTEGDGGSSAVDQISSRRGLGTIAVVIGAIGVYLAALPGSRRLARLLRRRAARANAQKVELAWREAAAAIRAAGVELASSDTPREFARRAGPRSTRPRLLAELAELVTASRYSGMEATDAEAQQARALSGEIVDGVRQLFTPGQRWRREIDPRPALRGLRRSLSGVTARRTSADDDVSRGQGGLTRPHRP